MENKEIISPEFIIFKGNKSFVFGIKGLTEANQKNIKDSINSSEASIQINEGNTLILHAGEQLYSFNLEPYFGFFSPSKFYIGFDFINEKTHLENDYRRMFRVQK